MWCGVCEGKQTFTIQNSFTEFFEDAEQADTDEGLVRAWYICASCDEFERTFFLKFGDVKGNPDNFDIPAPYSVIKIGQYPPWSIEADHGLEKLLGRHATYYRNGLVCESQGYGIAAFAYYRRVVEEVIDHLLDDISTLLATDEQSEYSEKLSQAKQTHVAAEKIALVKDFLPPVLRPSDMNPLSILHGSLSEGLHGETDECCMELSASVREVLVYLVNQVEASKKRSEEFAVSMRSLLKEKERGS